MWMFVMMAMAMGCFGQVKALQEELAQLEEELEDLEDQVDELSDDAGDSGAGDSGGGVDTEEEVNFAPSVVYSLTGTTSTDGSTAYDLAWKVEGDVQALRTSLWDNQAGTMTTLGAVPCGDEGFESPKSYLVPVIETWTTTEYTCWTTEIGLFPQCLKMVKLEEITCDP